MRMKPNVKRKNILTFGSPPSLWDWSPINWGNRVGISIGQTHVRMHPTKPRSSPLSASLPASGLKPKDPQGDICISSSYHYRVHRGIQAMASYCQRHINVSGVFLSVLCLGLNVCLFTKLSDALMLSFHEAVQSRQCDTVGYGGSGTSQHRNIIKAHYLTNLL